MKDVFRCTVSGKMFSILVLCQDYSGIESYPFVRAPGNIRENGSCWLGIEISGNQNHYGSREREWNLE